MLTFLFINHIKERPYYIDFEDILIEFLLIPLIIILDIILMLFQPIFYIAYKYIYKYINEVKGGDKDEI